MANTSAASPTDKRNFLSDLALMLDRAHRLGLHKTGHAIHEAVRVGGYELAEHLSPPLTQQQQEN